jgi:hypothetical protein
VFYVGLGPSFNKCLDTNGGLRHLNSYLSYLQLFAERPAGVDDSVTNIVAMGAHERTEGAIELTQNGAVGFKSPGDRMCWKIQVLTAGLYDTTIFYTSTINATFTLMAGSWRDILKGTAAKTTANLPTQVSACSGCGVQRLSVSHHLLG